VKTRRQKIAGARREVGFSAQFIASAPWVTIMDSRLVTRLVQVLLGEHFTTALAEQFDPKTGQRLPPPRKTDRKKNGKLGIQTGKMLRNWQMGKVTGKISRSRGIVQPYADGASGDLRYSRRFFLEYMLGTRTYTVTDPKKQKRDARGLFIKGGATKGPGPRFDHAPVDFQHVDGLAAVVIRAALDEYINDSGLKTDAPLLPPPDYLGAGNLSRVRDASGL